MRLAALLAVLVVVIVSAAFAFESRRSEAPGEPGDCPPDGGQNAVVPSPTPTQSPTPVATPTPPAPTLVASATPTATFTVTASATIPVDGPADTLAMLQQDMERAVSSYTVAGRYAVAVTDLQTGETVGVNAGRKQLAACSMNLFVLLQATLDMQNGAYTEAEADQAGRLMAATTWSSNATTARDLYTIAGGGDTLAGVGRVDQLIREMLGLRDTVLDHPPLYGQFSLGRGDNWITANDANRALVALWQGDILTPQWRDYLLKHLATVKPGLNYLTASVPGTLASHKNGFFEYGGGFVDNDVGIVRFQGSRGEVAFAISFLAETVPVKYADITLGQELVRLAYAYFRAAYD